MDHEQNPKTPPDGAPSWLELGAPSGSPTRQFFERLFGWAFVDMQDDNFRAELASVGIGLHPGDDPGMLVFFRVTDIEEAAARVTALGGTLEGPIGEQGAFGSFVLCKDPQGIRFGLHRPPPSTAPAK